MDAEPVVCDCVEVVMGGWGPFLCERCICVVEYVFVDLVVCLLYVYWVAWVPSFDFEVVDGVCGGSLDVLCVHT